MKDHDFTELVVSIKEAGGIKRGTRDASRSFEFGPAEIRGVRNHLHKSQAEFARMLGVSKSTLQNWEQGRRRPVGPARALLKVAAENPGIVEKALA